MTTENGPAAQFPRAIDATMRSDFLRCPHYFFRRHCQGLTTLEGPSIDLWYGGCLAKGLETSRRAYAEGFGPGSAVIAGSTAILKEWGDFQFDPRTRAQQNKSLQNCLLAHRDYFRQWPLDSDHVRIHLHNGEPCVEFAGAVPIPGAIHPTTGEELLYAGRFDMIGDYQRAIWGVDDKSTGSSVTTRDWSDQWRLRGQFTGYTWIAHEHGLPILGFLIRGIQVLTDSTRLAEAISPRPQWMVDKWLATLQADVSRMVDMWEWSTTLRSEGYDERFREADFPQILDAGCFSYNRPCEYMPLCSAEHPERWLDTYRVNRWNPLERTT
jgi:hypothetical protein